MKCQYVCASEAWSCWLSAVSCWEQRPELCSWRRDSQQPTANSQQPTANSQQPTRYGNSPSDLDASATRLTEIIIAAVRSETRSRFDSAHRLVKALSITRFRRVLISSSSQK